MAVNVADIAGLGQLRKILPGSALDTHSSLAAICLE